MRSVLSLSDQGFPYLEEPGTWCPKCRPRGVGARRYRHAPVAKSWHFPHGRTGWWTMDRGRTSAAPPGSAEKTPRSLGSTSEVPHLIGGPGRIANWQTNRESPGETVRLWSAARAPCTHGRRRFPQHFPLFPHFLATPRFRLGEMAKAAMNGRTPKAGPPGGRQSCAASGTCRDPCWPRWPPKRRWPPFAVKAKRLRKKFGPLVQFSAKWLNNRLRRGEVSANLYL